MFTRTKWNTQLASAAYLSDPNHYRRVFHSPPFVPSQERLPEKVELLRMIRMLSTLTEVLQRSWWDQEDRKALRFLQKCAQESTARKSQKMWIASQTEGDIKKWICEVLFERVQDKEFGYEKYKALWMWVRGCIVGICKRDEGWSYHNTAWCLVSEMSHANSSKMREYRLDCWLSPKLMENQREKGKGVKGIRHYLSPKSDGYTVRKSDIQRMARIPNKWRVETRQKRPRKKRERKDNLLRYFAKQCTKKAKQ